MYRRISAVLFPVLAILLIAAAFWGYNVSEERNVVMNKAENQYQRAFHNLAYHLEELENELGNSLAVNQQSQPFQRKCLLNIWRITSEAQNEISQLPLGLIPFSDTEQFLAKMATFSYQTGVRDMKDKPLTDDEVNTLNTLYDRSKEIASDIRTLQSEVLTKQIRWTEVEMLMAGEGDGQDNSVVDGFKSIDKKVSEYSEVQWGPSTMNIFQTRSFQKLDGRDVTAEDIKQKATDFFGLKDSTGIKVTENGQGTEYATYSVVIQQDDKSGQKKRRRLGEQNDEVQSQGNSIQMDYSKKGGKLLWFMKQRDVQGKTLSIEQASEKAGQFLENRGYKHMQAVSYDEYQNIANLTFATVQDDIIVYPEKVSVRVALDNGEMLGLQATDYVYEHNEERKFETPKLSKEEAKKALNPKFKIQRENMALIQNDLKEQVYCYEYLGKINGKRYRIYINADTGIEEKLEVIRDVDTKLEPKLNNT